MIRDTGAGPIRAYSNRPHPSPLHGRAYRMLVADSPDSSIGRDERLLTARFKVPRSFVGDRLSSKVDAPLPYLSLSAHTCNVSELSGAAVIPVNWSLK